MAPDVNKTSILLCTSGLRSADSGRTPGQFQTPEPGSERSLPRRHPSLTRPQLTALSLSPSRIRPAPLPLRAAQEACSLSATNGPSAHVFNVEIKYLYASSIASHKLTPEAADAGRAHSHESEVAGRAAGCSGCHQDPAVSHGAGLPPQKARVAAGDSLLPPGTGTAGPCLPENTCQATCRRPTRMWFEQEQPEGRTPSASARGRGGRPRALGAGTATSGQTQRRLRRSSRLAGPTLLLPRLLVPAGGRPPRGRLGLRSDQQL